MFSTSKGFRSESHNDFKRTGITSKPTNTLTMQCLVKWNYNMLLKHYHRKYDLKGYVRMQNIPFQVIVIKKSLSL